MHQTGSRTLHKGGRWRGRVDKWDGLVRFFVVGGWMLEVVCVWVDGVGWDVERRGMSILRVHAQVRTRKSGAAALHKARTCAHVVGVAHEVQWQYVEQRMRRSMQAIPAGRGRGKEFTTAQRGSVFSSARHAACSPSLHGRRRAARREKRRDFLRRDSEGRTLSSACDAACSLPPSGGGRQGVRNGSLCRRAHVQQRMGHSM